MNASSYQSAAAFKEALEQRLKNTPKTGVDLNRRRQLVVFDRFLARVVKHLGESVTLKGGLALEIRLERARTTKDIDLRVVGSRPSEILERLQTAARHDLQDFMRFTVQADERHPEIDNPGLKYGGRRFRAECRLAGKIYGSRFPVDVGFGDPMFGEPESVRAKDHLGFAGISPPTLRIYPVESHLAEKLHAYTMPRDQPNSRVKDLPDIALISIAGRIDADNVRAAIEQTFSFRTTHDIPTAVPHRRRYGGTST